MSLDLFEQLRQRVVPPPPAELERDVHRRLNAVLLTTHLFDFAFHAIPQAFVGLSIAAWNAIAYSITGRWDEKTVRKQDAK